MKKTKLFGDQNPYVWCIEILHGCNLACHHCAMSVLDRTPRAMSMETWKNTMKLIAEIGPEVRIELAMGGEPTLHPLLYEFLKVGRKMVPNGQFQITTNGTMLHKGQVTYKGILEAGCNIVYTDMYSPRQRFHELAKAAKEEGSAQEFWFYYPEGDEPPQPDEKMSPWTYHGPHIKWIPLQNNPSDWPKSRQNAGLLGTWFNHIDPKKAIKFGMKPVTLAPFRRCNQPFLYVPVSWTGDYILCCQDMALETVGNGSVNEGMDGFKKWWFGDFMQEHRRWLREKDRMKSPFCSRCSITFSRCDYKHWSDEQVSKKWDGKEWVDYEPKNYRVKTGVKYGLDVAK